MSGKAKHKHLLGGFFSIIDLDSISEIKYDVINKKISITLQAGNNTVSVDLQSVDMFAALAHHLAVNLQHDIDDPASDYSHYCEGCMKQ